MRSRSLVRHGAHPPVAAERRASLRLEAEPAQERLRHLLGLLDGRHMAAVLDDHELGAGNRRRNLLVLGERAPAVLAADHDEGRAGDRRQERPGVGAVEKRADLPAVLLGRRPHAPSPAEVSISAASRFASSCTIGGSQRSARAPMPSLEGEIDEDLPRRLLSLPARVHAGVEQSEPGDALGRQPHHLEGGPRAHGMADGDDRPLPQRPSAAAAMLGDRVSGEVRDGDIRQRLERRDLRRPDARVAQEAGKENDFQRWTTLMTLGPV